MSAIDFNTGVASLTELDDIHDVQISAHDDGYVFVVHTSVNGVLAVFVSSSGATRPQPLHVGLAYRITVSSDGKQALVQTADSAILYAMQTGAMVSALPQPGKLRTFTFNPATGGLVIIGSRTYCCTWIDGVSAG